MLANDSKSNQIINATLKLLETKSWPEISFIIIAQEAKIPLSELQKNYLTKQEVLVDFFRTIDQHILMRVSNEENDWRGSEELPRDRLFDVIMMRFEAMQDYKIAIKNLSKSFANLDTISAFSIREFITSQNWLLQASNISTGKLTGKFRVLGISAVYLNTLQIWLNDDDPNMSKTMALLDKRLKQGEGWLHKSDCIVTKVSKVFCKCGHEKTKKQEEEHSGKTSQDGTSA